MSRNGEAIYPTRPWIVFGDTSPEGVEIRNTKSKDSLYMILLNGCHEKITISRSKLKGSDASLLSTGRNPEFQNLTSGVEVKIPKSYEERIPVLKVHPIFALEYLT